MKSVRHARLAVCVALCLVFAGAVQQARADVVYAVDGGGMASASYLYTVNTSTAAVQTTVGPITLGGSAVPISGMAFDPVNGMLYAVTNQTTNTMLVTINTATGQATAVGTVGFGVTALAFDPSGTLYAYSKSGITGNSGYPAEALYKLSIVTGTGTLVGTSNLGSTKGDAMAVSAGGVIFFSGNGSQGQLSNLSTTNGAGTTFANLTGGPAVNNPIKGFAFDNSGNLYGVYNGSTNDLLSISTTPVNGDVTITDIGTITGMESSTSIVTALAFQPASVPEPTSLALVSVAAVGGLVCWGRRRSTAVPAAA